MGRGTPGNGGRGKARARNNNNNNNSTYGQNNGGPSRTNKLGASALGLVSPIGGVAGLRALGALHATVGLGGLQQQWQLSGFKLLGGGTGLLQTVTNRWGLD